MCMQNIQGSAPPPGGRLWTLSFGLSHFHGFNTWFVVEVALSEDLHSYV